MRMIIGTVLIALAMLAISGCDSSTEPEAPALKTGANAGLAIELPLIFPPAPRQAQILTEWSVLEAGAIWFRNASENPIDLEMWVTNTRTAETNRVGIYRLPAFSTNAMQLDEDFTTDEYRYLSWTMRYRQGYQVEVIRVGFAP